MTAASAYRPGQGAPGGHRRTGGSDGRRPVTFRDLPGVGPAIDRRLRDTGLTSLADLAHADGAELFAELADVRGLTLERVHEWITAAADRLPAAEAGRADEPPEPRHATGLERGERQESFVLTLGIDGSGQVNRSTIRHTRTGTDEVRPDLSAPQLIAFVRRHARLPTGAPAGDGDLPAPSPGRPRPRPPEERVRLEIDAGHVLGGAGRPVRVVVAPPAIPWEADRYDYDLSVAAYQVGRHGWRPLGRVRGRGITGQDLVVDAGTADLPSGVHRLRLSGHIRAAAPDDGPSGTTRSSPTGRQGRRYEPTSAPTEIGPSAPT